MLPPAAMLTPSGRSICWTRAMIWLESWVAETPVAVCPVTDTW